jgi:cation transport ATPase
MQRFSVSEALVGDLVEARDGGRSATWLWRQALAALVMTAAGDVRAHPWRSLRAMVAGWVVLLLLFGLLGDRAADSLAHMVWAWTRADGYGSHVWWPFQLAAVVVSYAGFGLSAWMVVRQDRRHAAAALLAYAVSIMMALLASGAFFIWFAANPVPVPHALFYLVSVVLPYQRRSGFVLVPLVSALCGLWGTACRVNKFDPVTRRAHTRVRGRQDGHDVSR